MGTAVEKSVLFRAVSSWKQQPVSAEIKTLEAVTVGIIAKLDEKKTSKRCAENFWR